MVKITFMGAGSTVFAKNILGDALLTEALSDAHIALYDIDPRRLEDSFLMLDTLNRTVNAGRARITRHLGPQDRREALGGTDFVINAIQVGGYRPATVADFEIPKQYGLRQTIGDTLGIGGIFRALRTIPVMLDFARDMEEVAPGAWMLNYTNPMCMVTGAMLRGSGVRTVGLCHSVQVCARTLLDDVGMDIPDGRLSWKIAGINHMAWLLEIRSDGVDLYPEIKARAAALNAAARKPGGVRHGDMVRLEIMRHFGYYVTESSEHNAEYTPYWIKRDRPDLIGEFSIPLDEYPRRCERQIAEWRRRRDEIVANPELGHTKTREYGAGIMEAIVTGGPYSIHGNVLNAGLVSNLPPEAVVEVPCLVDRNGVQGCRVGALPSQCAALNMTNVNVQNLAVEAALSRSRELAYQAAYLDPRCAAELTLEQIRDMCDELFEAHREFLPEYR